MTGLAPLLFVALTVAMAARAGLGAAAGRTGLVDTTAHDRLGAWRGVAVGAVLTGAVASVGVVAVAADVLTLSHVNQAVTAQLWVYAPFAIALAISHLAALSPHWRLRSVANALGVGGLEFMWPAVAGAGVGLAVLTGATAAAALVGACVAAVTLITRPLVNALWYPTLAKSPY